MSPQLYHNTPFPALPLSVQLRRSNGIISPRPNHIPQKHFPGTSKLIPCGITTPVDEKSLISRSFVSSSAGTPAARHKPRRKRVDGGWGRNRNRGQRRE
jgi:hypothetical protein